MDFILSCWYLRRKKTLFNEIHVNAHVRTYELYSYLPSFGHNDFFFSIQSK